MFFLTESEIEFIKEETKELKIDLPRNVKELKKILRKLFRKYHPDKLGENYDEVYKGKFLIVHKINEKIANESKVDHYGYEEIDLTSFFDLDKRHSQGEVHREQSRTSSSEKPIKYLFKGERLDGKSSWILKYLEKVEIDKNAIGTSWTEPKEERVLYKYSFKEIGDCADTTERILYTEMSPEYINKINNSEYSISRAFQSYFFQKERTQKIFREVTPNKFGEWFDLKKEYLVNGYAGYIRLASIYEDLPTPFLESNEKMLDTVYNLAKQEKFIKPLKQGFIKFKRGDNTTFELKYNKRLDSLKDIFIYSFKDSQIDSGEEKTLYTELSPEDIYRLTFDQNSLNSLSCFVNDFLGVKRLKQVFSKKPARKFESLNDLFNSTRSSDNDEHIGNGYAGYIEERLWGWSRRIPQIKCCEFSFDEVCSSQGDTSYGEEAKSTPGVKAVKALEEDDDELSY